MAVDNAQPPGSSQQSSSVYVADLDARARKRAAIGLDPDRATAPDTFMRPPDDGARGAQWLLVACVALLAVAVLMLLVAPLAAPDSTLASIFGTRVNVQTGVVPQNDGSQPALPPYLALLPGYQLWVTDDFAAPSLIAPERTAAGGMQSAVVMDQGVYRMQAPPAQLAWTLFDLAQTASYHLETSALVDAASPSGAAAVIGRFAGSGSFYLMTVDGAGAVVVQLWLDGTPYTLQSNSTLTHAAGDSNRLAVEDDGTRLRFFANQVLVAEILEPALPYARPGIGVVAPADAAATVDFDWIAIYRAEP